jgi:quinoprotein glucose dehydrogenase
MGGATAAAVVVLLMAVLLWRWRRNQKLRKQPHAQ